MTNEKKNAQDSKEIDSEITKSKKKIGKVIFAKLMDDGVLVEDHQDARIIYDNGFYGLLNKDKTLTLNFEEALHLMERGVIKVSNPLGVWLEVNDCARIFSETKERFWTDYLVYKDLRNRGYVIGRGISDIIKYRVYPRGGKIGKDEAKTLICPLAEGNSINIETLDKIVAQSQSLKKRLLVACVDRLGDVSFYEIQPLFKDKLT